MKIVKKTIVIDIAKLVSDHADNTAISVGDDLTHTLAQVVTELTGDQYVVEASILPDAE